MRIRSKTRDISEKKIRSQTKESKKQRRHKVISDDEEEDDDQSDDLGSINS